MSVLQDGLVETSDVYFDHAKEKMAFFYPLMDLSLLNMLKVTSSCPFAGDADDPSLVKFVAPPVKDSQVTPEANKVMKDTKLEVTHQRDTLEEKQASGEGQQVGGYVLFLFSFVIVPLAVFFNFPLMNLYLILTTTFKGLPFILDSLLYYCCLCMNRQRIFPDQVLVSTTTNITFYDNAFTSPYKKLR